MVSHIKNPTMYDLVYDGGCLGEIKQAFPLAEIEDASDFIHEGRFSVQLPEDKRREYLKFIMLKGISPVSLMFQTDIGSPKHQDEIKDIVDEIKRESSEANPENNTKSLETER